jgi:hypothetical protein
VTFWAGVRVGKRGAEGTGWRRVGRRGIGNLSLKKIPGGAVVLTCCNSKMSRRWEDARLDGEEQGEWRSESEMEVLKRDGESLASCDVAQA